MEHERVRSGAESRNSQRGLLMYRAAGTEDSPTCISPLRDGGRYMRILPILTVLACLAGPCLAKNDRNITVIQDSAEATILRVVASGPIWEEYTAGGRQYTKVLLPDAVSLERPGEPDLPVFRFMVGLPPATSPSVTITASNRISYRDIHIPPASKRTLRPARPGGPLEPVVLQQTSRHVPEPYPRQRARAFLSGRLRTLDVAYLEVCPFQYFPSSGLLCLDQELVVTIRHTPRFLRSSRQRQALSVPSLWEPVLSRAIVNYDTAKAWQQGPPSDPATAQSQWDPPLGAYKLLVDQEGYYSVTGTTLQNAGVALQEISPASLQLICRGEEIPLNLITEHEHVFTENDMIEFIGEPVYRDDPGNRILPVGGGFTETNVYWLVWGGEDGLRMEERAVDAQGQGQDATYFRQSIHLEKDLNPFIHNENAISGDRFGEEWYWGPPLYPSPPHNWVDYGFSLHGVAPVEDPVHMRLTLRGYTHPGESGEPNHHAQVYLNGSHFADLIWWMLDEVFFDSHDPQWPYDPSQWPNSGVLNEGENAFSVLLTGQTGYGDFDGIYTDWFELDYWRTYNAWNDSLAFSSPQQSGPGSYRYSISGFTEPNLILIDLSHLEILSGYQVNQEATGYTLMFTDTTSDSTRYLAITDSRKHDVAGIIEDSSSDLEGLPGGDFVIISHEELIQEAERLGEERWFNDQPISCEVIDVQDIYDEYSYGIFNPEVIRDFLAFAYQSWNTAFVLLLGDASWDYKINSETSDPTHRNFVPSVGNPVLDDYFANVDDQGGLDSLLPDLYLSRIPVENADTARAVVDKLLSYMNGDWAPPDTSGDWRENILLLAGGYLGPDGDTRAYFEGQCNLLINNWVLPEPAHYTPILFTRPDSAHHSHPDSTSEDEMIEELFNTGGAVHATYIGHGASWTWETMFWASDVQEDLSNTTMLPMVNSMTCHTGRFANPEIDSFGEIWLWQPHGAMGFLGSTGWGETNADYLMMKRQFEAIFAEQERYPIVAVLLSKVDADHFPSDILDPMSSPLLFEWNGDPLVRLALAARPDWVLRPGDIEVGPQPILPGDTVTVTVNVRNEGIDPAGPSSLRLFDADPDSGGSILSNVGVHEISTDDSAQVSWEWVISDDAGEYSVHAWVNPDTSEQESFRGNNRTSALFTVFAPIPDLVVADSAFWVEPESPQVLDNPLTVFLRFSNCGTGPAPQFRVHVSDSSFAEGTVRELCDSLYGGLDRGEVDTLIASWPITDLDAGGHLLTGIVDWRNEVAELDTSNNRATTSVYIAARAELEAEELWVSNENPPEGDDLTITGIWSNTGESSAPGFHTVLFHGHPDSAASYVVADSRVDSLAGGAQDSLTTQWPTLGQVGSHTFYLVVDADDDVAEASDDNNQLARGIEVLSGPDLLVPSFVLSPESPIEGDSAVFEAVLRNAGLIDAQSFETMLELDQSVIQSWDTELPGQTETVVHHGWHWEQGESGHHTLTLTLDAGSTVEETNENNNVTTAGVYVMTLADLVVELSASADFAVEGDTIWLESRVRNDGEAPAHTVRLDWDQSIDLGQTWTSLESIFIPEIEGGSDRRESTSVIVEARTYWFRTTVSTPVEESTTANNQDSCVVTVRERYPADLSILATAALEDTVIVGNDVTITLDIINSGEMSPDSAWLEIRSVPSDTVAFVSPLVTVGPADTARALASWPVPHGQTNWHALVLTLPEDPNPGDNGDTVTVVGLWPPEIDPVGDLVVTPLRPLSGDTVALGLTVRNSGETPAPPFTVALFRGDPASAESDTVELLETITLADGLGTGEAFEAIFQWATPEAEGKEELYVWLDATRVVAERDESNNILGTTIEILARDFSLDDVTPLPSPASGRTAFLIRASHEADVSVRLYTVTGRLIESIGPVTVSPERNEAIEWLCTDRDGDRVANGVYLFRVHAASLRSGQAANYQGKVVVRR